MTRTTDILDILMETGDNWPVVVSEIKSSDIPLVVLGSGHLASLFYDKLQEDNVAVDEIAVHQQFWQNRLTFKNKEVKPFEEIIKTYKVVNVFIALQHNSIAEKIRFDLIKYPNIANVYVYDTGCTHFGFCDLDRAFVEQYHEELTWLFNELSDELSKQTLLAYLATRISGKTIYLKDVFNPEHLFPSDIINLNDQEVFVDCGSFDGQSILDFEEAMKRKHLALLNTIFAIEPDEINASKILIRCRHIPNVKIIKCGIWDEKTRLSFSSAQGATSRISLGSGDTIEVDTLDNILHDVKPTYIKMDIEGAEKRALVGAQMIISAHKPNLGICVYHRASDLVEIPRLIKQYHRNYRLFLRAHSLGAHDLLLYAV